MDDFDWDYDFTMGGGDQTYFGSNTLGDTSWIDNFDWGSALDSLDFSGLDLSGFDFGNLLSGDIDLGGVGYDTSAFDLSGLDLGGAGYDTGAFGTYVGGTEGFGGAADEVGGANYISGIEGFADAADEVGGAGGYNEEDLKDKFWKELIGTGKAVPGVGTLSTDSKGRTIITYEDGTTKVLDEGTGKGTGGGTGGGKGGGNTGKLTDNNALLMALLGGLLGLLGRKEAPKLPVGYQGGIPKYTATRVPGRGVQYTKAAAGGLMGLKQGRYLDGATDGMADKIQTDIDGKQPARLSHGEFVVSADVVSALGSGNSEAGADVLYDMMDRVRKHAHGHKRQIKPVDKSKVLPA